MGDSSMHHPMGLNRSLLQNAFERNMPSPSLQVRAKVHRISDSGDVSLRISPHDDAPKCSDVGACVGGSVVSAESACIIVAVEYAPSSSTNLLLLGILLRVVVRVGVSPARW